MNPTVPKSNALPYGGWAPGEYFCVCRLCDSPFVGDKRAIHCAPCVYGAMVAKDEITVTRTEETPESIKRRTELQRARFWTAGWIYAFEAYSSYNATTRLAKATARLLKATKP